MPRAENTVNLNRIAKELLEEKRKHARTLPARLCGCGCREPIVRRPNEALTRFKARKFVSQEHRAGQSASTPEIMDDRRCIVCHATFNRRRYRNGRLEGRTDYEQRNFCPEHTSAKNGGGHRNPASTFSKDTKLPDPKPLLNVTDNPKNESNMKRLPSLLEAERASGATLEPVPIEQFECAARRAKRLHPDFAAMLKGQEVREPVAGEVTV